MADDMDVKYCRNCGQQLSKAARYCDQCGEPTDPDTATGSETPADQQQEAAPASANTEDKSDPSPERVQQQQHANTLQNLADISGVDQQTAEELQEAGYSTTKDINEASQHELSQAGNMSAALAGRIKAEVGDSSKGNNASKTETGNQNHGGGGLSRRNMVAGGVLGVLSLGGGIFAVNEFILSSESGPRYTDVTAADLLPPAAIFVDDVTRDDEFNQSFDTTYLPADGSFAVLASVTMGNTVSEAKDEFAQSETFAREPRELPIGDDGFSYVRSDETVAEAVFRHSNAVANFAAVIQSGVESTPDETRARRYARTTFQYWQDEIAD